MTLGEQRRKALELLAPPPSRHFINAEDCTSAECSEARIKARNFKLVGRYDPEKI
jgi:hypothetical protein